jgi:hypothetical protein
MVLIQPVLATRQPGEGLVGEVEMWVLLPQPLEGLAVVGIDLLQLVEQELQVKGTVAEV